MRSLLLSIVLLVSSLAEAQIFNWNRDSSGVWSNDISFSNLLIKRGVSLSGEDLLFTAHQPEGLMDDSCKESSHLIVSRILPNGEPQVIKRLNFVSYDIVFRSFNNQYYILTRDHDIQGGRHNNVILEYDSAWNFICFTRVELPHHQSYIDFIPTGNQAFYLLSEGLRYPTKQKTFDGAFVAKSGKNGKVESRRFFPFVTLSKIEMKGDSITFWKNREIIDNTLHYSIQKDSIFSCECDLMLNCSETFEYIRTSSNRETVLAGGGHATKINDGLRSEITFFDSNNDSLWTWVAPLKWNIHDVVSTGKDLFVASFYISECIDSGMTSEGIVLVLFDRNMNQTTLWKRTEPNQNMTTCFSLMKLFYSKSTNSIQLIYPIKSAHNTWPICFESVFLPD